MKTKKLFSYFLAITLMMGTFCALPAKAATNSVNFDGAGYGLADEMWEVYKNGTKLEFDAEEFPAAIVAAESDVTPNSGTKMVKVTGEAGKTVELKKVFDVVPGKNYVASVYMNLTEYTAEENGGVKMQITDGNGASMTQFGTVNPSYTGMFVEAGRGWRKMYAYIFAADKNLASVDFAVSITGAGTVYFDDVLIEEAPLLANGDFEGLYSDFVPACWSPHKALVFIDPKTGDESTYSASTFLSSDETHGQYLVHMNSYVLSLYTNLETGAKYKLTFDYYSSRYSSAAIGINYKTENAENPFLAHNTFAGTAGASSTEYKWFPRQTTWKNNYEYYFTVDKTVTKNHFIALGGGNSGIFKADNFRLEKVADNPTVSITQNGNTADRIITGGGTAKVSFSDAYAPLTATPVTYDASYNKKVAYKYESAEASMVVAVYTKNNVGIKQLVAVEIKNGKVETCSAMANYPSTKNYSNTETADQWCHGEAPLKLETDITFGTEGDGKTYEIEAFIIGDNLKPMYKTSELVYN